MKYRIESVERLPSVLARGIVYVSEEYEMAALSCACGCGHRVNLLLGDGHQVVARNGIPTVEPSIGVWDAPCRSHFWIRDGEVVWDQSWSAARIDTAMAMQLGRHIAMDSQRSRPRWYVTVWRKFRDLFRRAR